MAIKACVVCGCENEICQADQIYICPLCAQIHQKTADVIIKYNNGLGPLIENEIRQRIEAYQTKKNGDFQCPKKEKVDLK